MGVKLPGHGFSMHSLISKDCPEQRSPSNLGDGFVQDRCRDLYPRPHVVEQLEKLPQGDQNPCTTDIDIAEI